MLLSIVVPMYNEEENIVNFYNEVQKVVQEAGYDYELIFVDDGSSDATPFILAKLSEEDAHVRSIILARNFGHQKALTCGLDYARGDAIITMDGDMQHPPRMIPELVGYWQDGYEVIQTVRDTTENVSPFKTLSSKIYYKMLNSISQVPIVEGGSDFRLIDRRVLETLRKFREQGRFLRGIIGGIGYKSKQIHFVAPPRFAGQSKFNLRKMLHFALDGVAAYSKAPLRIAFYTGTIIGIISILLIFHILYVYFFTNQAVEGWATLGVAIFLLGGIQLISLGIIGEYVGRVFEEVKGRPLYWIRDSFNCDTEPEEQTDKQ